LAHDHQQNCGNPHLLLSMLTKMPSAKASEVVAAVKKEYGHEVRQNLIYLVKTKSIMAADRRESPITTVVLCDAAASYQRILSGPPARQNSLTSAGTILGEMVSPIAHPRQGHHQLPWRRDIERPLWG
jgi:hypothetical protein